MHNRLMLGTIQFCHPRTSIVIMLPTSKKLERHIASGKFVRASVRPSDMLFDA